MALEQGIIPETSGLTFAEKDNPHSLELKVKETKYDKKRLALGRIISSPHKTRIIETLHSKKVLSAILLYKQSGTSSEGTFFYHLRDLEWLGVIEQHSKIYKLTEFGEEIANSLSKLP